MKRILFVCTGNTCRSPMAEAILKQKIKWAGVKGFSVSSAGISATDGDRMNDKSKAALKQLGIKSSGFKARRLTSETVNRADVIICMTAAHRRAVCSSKAVSVGEITGDTDIADPYGLDLNAYIECSHEIERACNIIMKKIILEEDS